MTKRDRELNQRLAELFSSDAEAPPPLDAAPPIEPTAGAPRARTLAALPPDLWKTVIEQLPLPVYLKDREHTWIAVNRACGDWLGRPPVRLIGHVDKEQSDEAWQLDDQALETQQASDTQTSTIALDGTIHTRRTRRVPILSEVEGSIAPMRYVLGLVEESVKPAQAEPTSEFLKNSEVSDSDSKVSDVNAVPLDNPTLARFQAIVEATPIPILITRLTDGRPLYVNARASALFGVAREDLLNHTTLEFYDDVSDRQKILEVLQRTGRASNYELRLKRPDGSKLWVRLDVQPLVYNNERAILSGFYDITARRQAEEQLRQLSRAVEQSPVSIIITDLNAVISYVNPEFSRLTGYALTEAIGQNPRILKSGRTAPDEYARLWAALTMGQTWRGELLNQKKNGELYWELASISPITDAAGRMTHYLAVSEDVTQRRQTEAALRRHDAYLAVLHETSLGLINRLNVTDLLTSVVTRAARLVDTPHGYLYLVNPAGTHLEVRVGIGIYASYIGTRLKPGEGLGGRVWQTGEPLRVDDYARWPQRADGFAHADFHAIAAVPLKSGDQVIGVIGVGQIEAGVYFSDPDLEILRRFAELASIALDNANLYQAAQQDITRRQQAEEQLRYSEALYQSLVDTLPENLCRKDLQGRFTYGNRHYCELTGLSLAELVGKTDFDIHPPDLAAKYRADDQAVLASGKTTEFLEAHAVLGANEQSFVRTIKNPLYDAGGQVIGIQIMFWDATELGRAEQSLKLRTSALEAAANGVAITDRAGQISWVNPAFTQVTGYAFEEAVGQNPRILKSGRQSDEFYLDLWQTISAGHGWQGELINRRKDGREYVEEITITPVRAHGGAITHFIAIMQDISQRKQTERNLAMAAEHLQLLIKNVPDLIYIKDRQSRWIIANQPVADSLGAATPADVIGKSDFDFHARELAAQFYAEEQALLASGESILNEEQRVSGPDGNPIWMLTTKVPFRNPDGQIDGLVGIARDVTERRKIEAERERLLAAEARRAVQLQTGSEIASAAAAILDPDKLLPVVVELMRDRYDLYYAGLFLNEATGEWAELRAGTGEAGRQMLAAQHRLAIGGASMIGRCMATGEPRIALDVGVEAVRFNNPWLPRTRSEMALPLISRGQISGALTLQSTELAAFTPDDINTLRIMVSQIATTIENARLFQETQRRAEEQAALFNLAQSLSAQLAVDQVLQQIYYGATSLIDTANFYIGLYDPARQEVDFVLNVSESVIDRGITTLAADQGMTGYILRTRRSLLITDHADDWLAKQGLARVGAAARSWLGVPLLLGDEVLGVMAVQNHTVPQAYTEHDRDLLQVFGAQAAIAIQNARLFEQTRAARATAESRLLETQILQQFSQTVSSTLDIDQVLAAVIRTLEQSMGFTHVALALIDRAAGLVRMPRTAGTAIGMQDLTRALADLDNDILMDIARQGQTEVIDGWDARLDRAIYEREGHADLVRAFVPVRLRAETIGLIEAGYRRDARAHITPEEVRVLGGLADQLAIAIDHARLLEQVQRDAEREHTINRIASRLRNAHSVEQALTIATQELRAATHSSLAVVEIGGRTL